MEADRAGGAARCPACRATVSVPTSQPVSEPAPAVEERPSNTPAEELPINSGWEHPLKKPAVIGGLGVMVLAAIWFCFGLSTGRFYYYPPVLFTLGLIAVYRSIFSGGGR